MQTAMELHASAMLQPVNRTEHRLVNLYRELDNLCQHYREDKQAETAVLSLARTIIALIDFGTGRLDQSTLDSKVRETVREAGFDAGTI